ncbi:hypothetical protein CRM22_003209 [Opisthorchis felineus]|uniref:Uncharacterized protein n=1 Tax=Opisthorchis felineus TaxID=147828 RepID=A0A4S2M2F3_OPIFE|nr:hypothetical protein CRM22_003209 [Opisthorchis felineus]
MTVVTSPVVKSLLFVRRRSYSPKRTNHVCSNLLSLSNPHWKSVCFYTWRKQVQQIKSNIGMLVARVEMSSSPNRSTMRSPQFVKKRQQTNCQARQTDQQLPDLYPISEAE